MAKRMSISEMVTAFVENLSGIPEHIRDAATIRVIDTVAVGIAGSHQASAERIRAGALHVGDVAQNARRASGVLEVSSRCSSTGSLVWGTDVRIDPAGAALANAAAVHSEDFDDTHTGGVVHGSACIVPAAWASAERVDASWSRLVEAVVLGWEIAARIGQASGGAFHRHGLHPTSVAGIFGAAAAVAHIRGLSPGMLTDAMGICGSMVSGLNAYQQNGSDGKLLNAGLAARGAIIACDLAVAGVRGPSAVLEGRFGLFETFGLAPEDVTGVFANLSQVWEIENVSTKPYPACHFAHATIDCARKLHELGVRPESVDSLVCEVPEPTLNIIARPYSSKLNPPSVYAARFSLPWLVALALIDGDVGRMTFTEALLGRANVARLAERVVVRNWPGSGFPYAFPGAVTAIGSGTSGHRIECPVNLGHPDRPLSDEEFLQKVESCLSDDIRANDDRPIWSAEEFVAVFDDASPTTRIRGISTILSMPHI